MRPEQEQSVPGVDNDDDDDGINAIPLRISTSNLK